MTSTRDSEGGSYLQIAVENMDQLSSSKEDKPNDLGPGRNSHIDGVRIGKSRRGLSYPLTRLI
jgi:hypothetical protein